MTRRSVAAGSALALAMAGISPAHANARREQADVYAAGSQRLLYREEHLVQPGASPERWVVYRCPDGKPFARKRVAAGGARPDFALEDARDGYREGVRGAAMAPLKAFRGVGASAMACSRRPAHSATSSRPGSTARSRANRMISAAYSALTASHSVSVTRPVLRRSST